MHGKVKCITHNLWDGLGQQIFGYLNSISLADICKNNQQSQAGANYADFISTQAGGDYATQ
jgi:DNA-binding IscR family transcriptional regulator